MRFDEQFLFSSYRFREAAAFVDVGANNGAFAWPFAQRGWPVIAIEPHPELAENLRRTFTSLPNVRVVQRAISDQAGVLPFYTSSEHPGIHSLAAFHSTHKRTTTVSVSPLRELLTELEVGNVAALKIDVEGADLLALQGFDFNALRPELVMAEFMDDRSSRHFGYTHHDMAHFMEEKGYETWVSEWEPLTQYAGPTDAPPHRWRSFHKYDYSGSPAHGNLLFIEPGNRSRLKHAVKRVLLVLRTKEWVRKVPPLHAGARAAKRVLAGGNS